MDNRIYAIFIVLSANFLAIWLLWPRVYIKHLKQELPPLQKITLQYFGMPILAGVAILLLLGLVENLVTNNQAAHFLDHLFRFALVNVVLSIGTNSFLHAIFIWPKQNETTSERKIIQSLAALPALLTIALGILLLVRFFQFS